MSRHLALVTLAAFVLGACGADDGGSTGPGPDHRADGGAYRDAGSPSTALDGASSAPDAIPIPTGGSDGGSSLCLTDADCANGNSCTTARCIISGEIGTCEYTPVADGASCESGGACPASCSAGVCHVQSCGDTSDAGTGQPSIDPMCPGTCPFSRLTSNFPPYTPLAPDDVPSTCANGFQLGGANGGCGVAIYTLNSTRRTGSREITLDVDFATYLVPDGVTVTGVDATGATYPLLATCRLQTWNEGGPSTSRPPAESIRQFRLHVRAGTTRIVFDFGPVTSPMYMRVVGLCDFDVVPFANARWWEAVP